MMALGRELYAAGESLLEASACLVSGSSSGNQGRSQSPRQLANLASGLRTAGIEMLDDSWEDVMGELEVASVSAEDYIPAGAFQGLIDLFAYEKPVPPCEWANARRSLEGMASCLANEARTLEKESGYTQDARNWLLSAARTLRRARTLFEPNGFYIPEDPRENTIPQDEGWDFRNAAMPGRRRGTVDARDLEDGGFASALLRRIEQELQSADLQQTGAERQTRRARALRRFVRELHPDANPGKEEQVLPIFQYVQQMREEDAELAKRMSM